MSITVAVGNDDDFNLSNGAVFDLFNHLGITLTGTEGEFTGADIQERMSKFTPSEAQKTAYYARYGVDLLEVLKWLRELVDRATEQNLPIQLF